MVYMSIKFAKYNSCPAIVFTPEIQIHKLRQYSRNVACVWHAFDPCSILNYHQYKLPCMHALLYTSISLAHCHIRVLGTVFSGVCTFKM